MIARWSGWAVVTHNIFIAVVLSWATHTCEHLLVQHFIILYLRIGAATCTVFHASCKLSVHGSAVFILR
jgi:hypothetical protein